MYLHVDYLSITDESGSALGPSTCYCDYKKRRTASPFLCVPLQLPCECKRPRASTCILAHPIPSLPVLRREEGSQRAFFPAHFGGGRSHLREGRKAETRWLAQRMSVPSNRKRTSSIGYRVRSVVNPCDIQNRRDNLSSEKM